MSVFDEIRITRLSINQLLKMADETKDHNELLKIFDRLEFEINSLKNYQSTRVFIEKVNQKK